MPRDPKHFILIHNYQSYANLLHRNGFVKAAMKKNGYQYSVRQEWILLQQFHEFFRIASFIFFQQFSVEYQIEGPFILHHIENQAGQNLADEMDRIMVGILFFSYVFIHGSIIVVSANNHYFRVENEDDLTTQPNTRRQRTEVRRQKTDIPDSNRPTLRAMPYAYN